MVNVKLVTPYKNSLDSLVNFAFAFFTIKLGFEFLNQKDKLVVDL